jgi:deazaflavin-dependent oxidoreductase (nitroreductase family)
MNTPAASSRYVRPNWFVQHAFNPFVAGVTRLGLSVWGSRVLEVQGRTSGEWRTTPVNLLTFDGARYLVAPRGETQWVKNVRVAGSCRLRVGRRVEVVSTTEIHDTQKPEILAAYLKRWKWEVGQFFDGVGPDSSREQLLAIAPGHPVFLLEPGPN